METSLVHFDTERSYGTIPAPLTWFPPAYPAAIALVTMAGSSYETAALWISMASFVLVAGGLWQLMRTLDASRWAARAVVLCWLVNSQAQTYSVSAISESLFTLLGLASLLFLVRLASASDNLQVGICRIGSVVMAALSYWVRYAGILWVAACLSVLSVELALREKGRRGWRTAIAAAAAAALVIMPLAMRNVILVGDWRGGNNTPFAMPLRTLATGTAQALFHLLFGAATVRQLWLPIAAASIGLLGVGVLAFARKAEPFAPVRQSCPPITKHRIVLAVSLMYIAGIAAIAFRSVISYEARMYVPVLPHLICLSVLGLGFMIRGLPARGGLRAVGLGMAACLALGYGAANLISRAKLTADGFQRTEEALLQPDAAGLSIKGRLSGELEPGEAIAATDGQIAGYILDHPTLSLAGRPYSLVTWDERVLRTEMARYGAKHLLLFRDAGLDPVVRQSQFLSALANGRTVPWLRLVASNRDVLVYRIQ